MSRSRPFLSCLIFAITLVVFSRLTTCNFTWWDDGDTIRQNRLLNPPTWETLRYYWTTADEHDTMGLYVPVTYMVWSALAKVGRLDHPDAEGLMLNPVVFHSANVVLHALTAVMVFWLLVSVFEKRGSVQQTLPASRLSSPKSEAESPEESPVRGYMVPAFLAALVFALHPVQVEPVGWISGTKDVLCGLLSVSALLMYVRSRYWLGMLLFVLAMLSKPTAVVVPLMAAVISVLLLDRSLRKTAVSLIPWGLLMIPCIIWTQRVQPAEWSSTLPIWDRPAVAADAVTFYLVKLVWPAHLCVDYGHNTAAIVANHFIYFTWILPAVLAGLLWWRYKHCRPITAAGLLFLMPLLPVLGLVPFEFQLISTTADHYLYLPMLGVSVLVAWMLMRYASLSSKVICMVVLLLLGIRSILQEPIWQDSRTLFNHALSINPKSVVSFDGLGFVTGRDARQLAGAAHANEARTFFDQSIYYYKKSLEFGPDSVPSMVNLALDYEKIGRSDLAREQLHQVVHLQKTLPDGLQADPIYLAHLLIDADDIPGAIAWLDDVLRRDPSNFPVALLRQQAFLHMPHTNS